jgi:hypothetical protein
MKRYKVIDIHGNDRIAENQLNTLLDDGWEIVCSLGDLRIILRNFDDDGNCHQENMRRMEQ